MDPHNVVAFHHHHATDSGVDIVESNLNGTNSNLSAVAAAAVVAAADQTSAAVSNNLAFSQRLNLMAASIFANSNNHSNTAANAAAAANSAFSFLTSTSSATAAPIERISPAIINSASNAMNISNSAAQFHSTAQSLVQQQPQSTAAAMAAAAAAALANLPSIAAAAAASASTASSNTAAVAAEYAVAAAAAAQHVANVNNVGTLNELRHNVVYPTNFSSYLGQNIQNVTINASSAPIIAAQPYALISSPFCTTASLNQPTCPMHRFVTSHFADSIDDDHQTFSMLGSTQPSFPLLNNSNGGVQQNSIQDNLQQTVQQRFLLVDNPNAYNRQRTSALSSSIVASNASRVMKRTASQISNNNSRSIEHQNNRVLAESLRNQNGNGQLLSTVIIPTSSPSNNNDSFRSRVFEDTSRLLAASSSRAPKLRRIGSIEEDIISANSNLQAVATTAIVQLQRQQQTQVTNTIMPFGSTAPNATLIQHNHQQDHHHLQQLQHVRSIINNSDNVVNPIATILQQNPSSSPSSVTVEQFMAAITGANSTTTREIAETFATISQAPAIVRPSSVPRTPEPNSHCAVCYQSTAATLIATPAAVTACNCIHHHHCHHPHHHHTICTVCQQQQTQINNQQQQLQHQIQQTRQQSAVAAVVAAAAALNQQQSIGHFVTAGASSTAVRHSPTTASAGALALPSSLINIAASLAHQTQNVAMVAQQNSVPA